MEIDNLACSDAVSTIENNEFRDKKETILDLDCKAVVFVVMKGRL